MIVDDMEKVDPRGRLDVMAYRGAQYLTGVVEEKSGLSGLWDAIKPHVNTLANRYVSGVDLPIEAKILLSIVQANYKKPIGQ